MNKKLTKVVNIYPSSPITGVNPPIRSAVRHVTKSVKDIRTCIINRAKVEEILPDGRIIRLGFDNYDKDNYITTEDVVETTVENTDAPVANTEETVSDVNVDETAVNAEEDIADEVNVDAVWTAAYNEALAGKDLESMTKKQRKDAKAEARATADAAVAAATTTVVNTDEPESVTAEEVVADVEVTTDDAEDLSDVVE